ncbi:VRR-NUC domain-containing protein [Komagataeibacter diospyri]|uniref:VRR-NUC domain-containing protein n=1 Tax=Komagataeibacter diospyri TaxID=1932662 RepID=UPI0037567D89
MMSKHEEDALHTFVWRTLTMLLPDDAVPWSSENRRNGVREGARRKARGCIPGVPDMAVHYQGRVLYIELKATKGTISREQRALHARLRTAGFTVGVCRSLDQVLEFLRENGVPVAGKVMA